MERVLEDRIDRWKQRLNRVVQEVAKTDGQQNLEGGPLGCAGLRLSPYRRKCRFAGHLWLRFINHCLHSTRFANPFFTLPSAAKKNVAAAARSRLRRDKFPPRDSFETPKTSPDAVKSSFVH